MKICIIAEGSYPYLTGGVSSWIQSIMTQMPEHEFIIYAIGDKTQLKGDFKYVFPTNLVEVKEIFLDEFLLDKGSWGHRFNLNESQQNDFLSLISGENQVNWSNIFDLLRSEKFSNASDFLSSKDYLDIVQKLASDKYNLVPFTELFWTIHSMILPLFLTIRHDIPRADVYHSVSTGFAGVVGALAKHIHKKPLILTEHGIYSREREEEIIKADWVKGYFKDLWIEYFYTLSGCIYDAADQVVTLFNRNKEIEVEIGCNESKIDIISNGVDITKFSDLKEPIRDGKIRIGAIVRVVPIKDIKTMIQSFGLIKNEVDNAELYIMGPVEEDPTYYKECLQMVESMGLKDVVFTGEVQIKEYINNMDIMMLTSISEGQPLAILEGMACSKPFVTTNVGSCKELIYGRDDDYGNAGIVASVMHYEELANGVIQLCGNEDLRKRMGENGYHRVRNEYSHHAFIASYRNLYQSLGG
ncbi:MAG: GT4 family glycosyltransferase PelF [Melioribacteraceae bacterium]|nr:GT4 family glycosyltransferase PelF [Melioribacteraceae bacterium]